MTDKSISAQTKTGSHKTATPHAQTYSWQTARLKGSGCRSFTALDLLLVLAEKVGRGLKPSDPWYSPSIETLVESMKADERSIRRSIALLARLGIIHVERDHHGRNLYRLATSPEEADRWQAAETLTPRNRHAQSQHQRTSQSNISGQVSPTSGHPCPDQRTSLSRPADILVQTSGHPCPVERDEATSTSALIVDTYDEKPTEKTVPIRQYEQTSELTKETDHYYKQRPAQICTALATTKADIVVVESFSLSTLNSTAGQPPHNAERITHIKQVFGKQRPAANNFGGEVEYQKYGDVVDTLDHYRIDENKPHVKAALKAAAGIPRRELGEAIQWQATDAETGAIAWYRIGKSFVDTWTAWKAMDDRRQLEQAEKLNAERLRLEATETKRLEDLSTRQAWIDEQERRAEIEAEKQRAQREHDAKPENILERTAQAIAQLAIEREAIENKRSERLTQRTKETEKNLAEYESHRQALAWKNNSQAFERMLAAHKKTTATKHATEDAVYDAQLLAIDKRLASFERTKQAAAQALLEAA